MEYLFHIRPPNTFTCSSDRFLTGVSFLPPQLRHGVFRLFGHIGSKIFTDILHIGKQIAISQENGIVADVAILNFGQNFRLCVGVKLSVLCFHFRLQPDNLTDSLHIDLPFLHCIVDHGAHCVIGIHPIVKSCDLCRNVEILKH